MMDGKSETLLKINEQSKRYGVALNPELQARLEAAYKALPDGVTPLPVIAQSSGPAHQLATPEALAEAGIPRLDDKRPGGTLRRRRQG